MFFQKDLAASAMRIRTPQELIRILETMRPLQLALFKNQLKSLTDNKASMRITKFLDSEELCPFWENKFNSIQPQFRDPAPQSKANYYCGYQLYMASMAQKKRSMELRKELKKTNSDPKIEKEIEQRDAIYEEFLCLAMSPDFNSYHAYQSFFQEQLTSLYPSLPMNDQQKNDFKGKLDSLYETLSDTQNNLIQFKTPGYLLMAVIYHYLSNYYEHAASVTAAYVCMQKCWKNLHKAALLEITSEKEIHNAYFGYGFKLSLFKLETITEIKSKLEKQFTKNLLNSLQKTLEAEAEEEIRNLTININSEEHQEIDSEPLIRPTYIGHR